MFQNDELEISSLPSITEIDFKSIARSYLKVILINNVVLYLVLIMGVFLAKRYLDIFLLEQYYVVIIVLLIGYCTTHLILSILGFHKRKFAVRTHDISFKKGVLYASLSTVPFSRIQHLDISQGILSRKFKLANLKLYTAGDNGSDMVIKGLPFDEAERIRGYITAQINERI